MSDCELDHLIPPEIKNDLLYRRIQEIAAQEDVIHILEIGSAAGQGSTSAFVDALRHRKTPAHLYCLEISAPRFAQLHAMYKNDAFIHCHRWSSVDPERFPREAEVRRFYCNTHTALNQYPLKQVIGWLHQDKNYLKRHKIPGRGIQRIKRQYQIDRFDMVLIDGSEFTGRAELDEVYGANILILDDINGYKNYQNYQRLKNDANYILQEENWRLRNGYAIFQRKKEMQLPIHFFTIVLNGEPFIRYHINQLCELPFSWHWHIVEGVADLKHDTAWSLAHGGNIANSIHQNGRSNDGTSEYIDTLVRQYPNRISVYRKPENQYWDGKLEMVNAPLQAINEQCLLWQIDVDEFWTQDQIIIMRNMFQNYPEKKAAFYVCHFFVGSNLIITSRNTYGNRTAYEWLRTWRYTPGYRWLSHEPPRLVKSDGGSRAIDIASLNPFGHWETEAKGLIFQHHAYVTEQQLLFKEQYYGYQNALQQWRRLQQQSVFPIYLRDFFPWVSDDALVDTVQSQNIEPIQIPSESSHNKVSLQLKKPKKILVVSHERSGTHLLINTIAFNFDYYNNNEISLSADLNDAEKLHQFLLIENSKSEARIFKSHHQSYFFESFLKELSCHSHIIYLVRDGRDVLTSLFYYYNKHSGRFPFGKSKSIEAFFQTKPDSGYCYKKTGNVIQRWVQHVESWLKFEKQIIIVKYEDLIHNFDHTVQKIGAVLGMSPIRPYRKPTLNDRCISPRKGVVGDWRNCFMQEDLNIFNTIAGPIMRELGYKEDNEDKQVNKILWVRTDAIGDNILAMAMLPHLQNKYPSAQITVLCQDHIAELYDACPYVDQYIAFEKTKAYQSKLYRNAILKRLQEREFDLCLNSVFSREPILDFFAGLCHARQRIALDGNHSNMLLEDKQKGNNLYTTLIKSPGQHKTEIKRHKDFLKGIDVTPNNFDLHFWFTDDDLVFADQFFTEHHLVPEKTIALFTGAQNGMRVYRYFGNAIADLCKERDFNVITLGAVSDFQINQVNLEATGANGINLSGKVTLRQSAALIRKCRLALGTETGLAHMASAVGTANVILLGGGHFGRFLPYSANTSVVCLPLVCFGCDWHCKHPKAYCVQSVDPKVIHKAVKHTLDYPSTKPRIFFIAHIIRESIDAEKCDQQHLSQWIDPAGVELIPVKDGQHKNRANPNVPQVSVIVSTYNAERFMRGCLEDLEAQTIADQIEIIVVDSGSQQNEAGIVREFQCQYDNIKYIRTTERESVYAAWNRGIKLAEGKYITNANTDDRHRRDAFEQMAVVLDENPDVVLVYADVIKTITANETFAQCTPTGALCWHDWNRMLLLQKGCFIGPQPMWRRTVHDYYGFFDEKYKISADYEFWLRISQTFDFQHIAHPLGLYLQRSDSLERSDLQRKKDEDQAIYEKYYRAAQNHEIIGLKTVKQLKQDCFEQLSNEDDVQLGSAIQGGAIMQFADQIFQGVQCLLTNGYKEIAIWVLNKLIVDYPDHAAAHHMRAIMAHESGDAPTAQIHFQRAADLAPQNPDYQKSLGDFLYVCQGEAETAITRYQTVVQLRPNDVETLLTVGHLYVSQHKFDQATEYYQRVLAVDPGNRDARQFLDKLNARSQPQITTTSPDQMYEQALQQAQSGDRNNAIRTLEQLIAIDRDNALAHNDLGVFYYEAGQKDKALVTYEKAVSLAPENPVFLKNLADFYFVEQSDIQKAMKLYVQVLTLNPQDVETLLATGQICIALNQTEDASDFFKKILEIEPWHADARNLLDQLNHFKMKNNSALPNKSEDIYAMAQTKAQSGDHQGAIHDLKTIIAQDPDHAIAYNDLGVLYYETGDKNQALQFYKQAVRLAPENPTFQKNLADLYFFEQSRIEDALKIYVDILKSNPRDIDCLMAAGTICMALGNKEDARVFFQRVLDIDAWHQQAQASLSQLDDVKVSAGNQQGQDPGAGETHLPWKAAL